MKAAVMHAFGPPEVLRYEDVADPAVGPVDALVRVHAVGVNRSLDVRVRAGAYHLRPELPHVLGCDPTGVVVALGDAADRGLLGRRVALKGMVQCGVCEACRAGKSGCANPRQLGTTCWGGYADYVAVPALNARPIPDNLSFAEASFVTRHFPQAFRLLEDTADLQPGEWLLVMGAAGALGSCLVQVGKLLGARVIAAAGSDERVASCLPHGADFGVNYRARDLAAEVRVLTDGHGADVVTENIGDAELWPGAFNSLAKGGRLVTAGAHAGGHVDVDLNKLYLNHLRLIGITGSRPRDVERTMREASAGAIHAVIGQVLPLAEAAEAHRLVEANAVTGKVLLAP